MYMLSCATVHRSDRKAAACFSSTLKGQFNDIFIALFFINKSSLVISFVLFHKLSEI
jgi:hypothetical protein